MRLPLKTLAAAALLTSSFLPAFADECLDHADSLLPAAPVEGVVSAVPTTAVPAIDIFAPSYAADPSGTFAGEARTAAHNQGTWHVAMLWYRGANDADINTQMVQGRTWASLLAERANQARAYYSQVSGGKLDLVFDVIEVPLDPRPDGSLWSSGSAQSTVLPTLGVTLAGNYGYVMNFYGSNTGNLIDNPNNGAGSAGLGTGASSGSGYSQTWFSYTIASTILHELGHNLSLSHARSYSTPSTTNQYRYDYVTKQYVATSGFGTGAVQNLPIGTGVVEYGHSYSVMAAYPGNQGLTPRQKAQNGWLQQKHFANINELTAQSADGVSNIRLYDDMADRQVVTNGKTGAELAYGVKNPYADVYYNASIYRPGETFSVNGDTGVWTANLQTLDFYYRSNVDAYPGVGTPTNAAGVVVDLNRVYMGLLTPGETFIEKDFSQSLSTVADTAAYGVAPLNPDRYRSVWYKIEYLDNGADGLGHFANIRVTALTGSQVVGWQWDADPLTAGAQDGSGVWNATDTRWRSVSLGVDNQNWTRGEDAVFGNGTGAAGTVTVSGVVEAGSVALKPAASGRYIFVSDGANGGTLALGSGGLVAEADALLAGDIDLRNTQIWSISKGKAVELTGLLTHTNGSVLNKMGQGTLLLSTDRTWSGSLAVLEGTASQTASQNYSGNGSLSLGEFARYSVDGGTLTLGNGKNVTGSWGTLFLNAGGTASAPEVDFLGASTISPKIQLSAGDHHLRTAGTAVLSGAISGSGNIVKSGTGSLSLNSDNTFTGSVTVNAGNLILSSWEATRSVNNVTLSAGKLLLDTEVTGGSIAIGNLVGAAGTSISATTSGDAGVRTLDIHQTFDAVHAGTVVDGDATRRVGLAKSGAATLTLAATNTYTGATTVNAGTLRAGATNAFGVNSAVTVASGATLDAAGYSQSIGSLSGAGAVTLGAGTLTTGSDNASTAFSGVISGAGGLVKNGSGALTLSGQNTYTGVTRVNGGEIRLDFSATAVSANLLSGASALELAGGDVVFVGRAGETLSQRFASTSVLGGISALRIERNGAASFDVDLGAITRTSGTLDFAGSTGAAAGARFITSTGSAGAMLPGGAWATVDGVNWAAKDATNTYIVAFSNYLDIPTGTGVILNSPSANVRIVEGGSGPVSLGGSSVTVNSLLMGAGVTPAVIATAGKTFSAGAIATAANARPLTVGAAANDGVLNGASGALTLLSNLDSASGSLTVNARVTDAGAPLALTVSGGAHAGTVVLAGDNTYTGGTTLTSGATLRVGAGGLTGSLGTGAVALESDTHLVFHRSDAVTLANLVSGEGDLTQSGTGSLTLAANNTYSGGTHVAGGTLRVGSGGVAGSLGSGAIDLHAGATLEFNRSDAVTLANTLSGAGDFVKSGTGSLALTALNAGYTGAITVNAGTLEARADTDIGIASALGAGANAITVNAGGTLLFADRRAAGLHSGAVTVNGGTITVNGQDNSFAGGNTVTFDTAAGTVSGSGQWRMRDAGTVVVNTAASGSSISVANLTLTGTEAGSYRFHVADGAAAADLIISSAITGQTGGESLTKTGAGTLKLTGANLHAGGTFVTEGRLLASGGGNLGTGAVTLDSATLAFTNEGLRRTSFSGSTMDIASAATGTLVTTDFGPLHNTSGITVPGNTTYAYTGKIYLTAGQWSFGENFDDGAYLKLNGQELLNNGAWNAATTGSITLAADGWYDIDLRVFNAGGGTGSAGGTWAGKGIGIKQGAASSYGSLYTRLDMGALGSSFIATGDITVANALALTGAGVVDTSAVQGGSSVILSGNLSGAGSLEKLGSSALVLSGVNSNTGATTVTGGTLRLGSATAFDGKGALTVAAGATFDANGYAFTTAALTGSGSIATGGATVTVAPVAGASATFSGSIAGAGGLTKSGLGTQVLTGANTYTGATTVNEGTLRLDFTQGAASVVSSASELVLAGGRLDVVGHATQSRTQTFAATRLTTETSATVSLTSTGAQVVLDLGVLTRTSGGAIDFVLDANPTQNRIRVAGFAPGAQLGDWATVNGGSAFAALSADGTAIVAREGGFTAIDVRAGGTRSQVIGNDGAMDVRIIQGGTTASDVTLAQTSTALKSLIVTASDAASIRIDAGQTLRVAGTGGVGAIVHGGTSGGLTLGTVANRGSLTGGTGGAAELILNNAHAAKAVTVNAAIVDNGGALSLTKAGAGIVSLYANNTYTGNTAIAAGVLRLEGAATLGGGSYAGAIANAGTLVFASASNQTLSGVISGSGALVKESAASTLTLSGENTYSGGTTVSVGTLRLGVAGALGGNGSVAIASGATLDAAGQSFTTTSLTGAGTLSLGAGTVTVSSGNFAGGIGGTGALSYTGVGDLTLSGDNSYTGATTIAAGKLTLGGAGRLGAGAYAGAITNAGALEVSTSSDQTLSGVISGAGTLAKSGAGTLTLSGTNTYSGATVINAGTVKIGRNRAFGGVWANKSVAQITVNAGGAVDLNGVGDATYGYTIAGTGVGGTGAITNTGGNIGTSTSQLSNLLLAGDASIGGTGHWALLTNGWGATTLDLAGYTLTKTGTNTISLASTSLTAGAIRVSQGGLALGVTAAGSGVSGEAASLTLDNVAGVAVTVNRNSTLGSLAGGGAAGGNAALGANTLTVGALNTDTTYAGVLSGANGSLVKTGTGTLTLAGTNTYTGATVINAGTLRLGDGATDGALATASAITNNGVLAVNNTGARTLANAITGSGSFVKTGAGALTLSGVNTYAGGTAVQSGSLLVSGSLTSALTVASGATLGGAGSTTGSLTFADGAGYSVSGTGFTASGVTLQGALAVSFDALPSTAGSVVLTYGSTLTGNLALMSAVNARAVFTDDTANKRIVATQVTKTDVWNTASGTWDNGVNANWTNGAEGRFYAGDSVVFNDPGVAATVTLTGDLAPAAVTVSSSNDYTFAGTGRIVGASGITKSGAGTLTLGTASTFTGNVSVNGGTLRLGNLSAFTGGGALSVAAGATFDANGNSFATSALTGAGSLTLGSAVATVSSGNFAGSITGAGALTKTGSGTLTLSGVNTHTGTTTVSGGTLAMGGSDALGAGALTVSGGTVNMGAYSDTVGAVTLTSGSILGSGGTLTGTSFALQSGTVSANLAGAAALTKSTAGTLTLSGVNTYTGTTSVTGGTIVISGASTGSALAVSSGAITLASGASVTAPSVSLSNGTAANAVLNIGDGASLTTQYINVGSGSGGSGTILQTGGSVTLLSGGSGFRLGHYSAGSNTALYDISGGVLDASGLASNSGSARVLNIGWDGNGRLSVGGGVSLATVKAYGIQLDASGASGAADTLTLSTNGVVELGAGGIASASAADKVVLNGGTLRATAAATWSATMTSNAATVSTFDTNGFAITASGAIDGPGGLSKIGAGTLTLSGNNTYAGATSVGAGRLVLTGTNASSFSVAAGAVFGGAGSTTGSVTFADGAAFAADAGTLTATGGVTLQGALNVVFDATPAAGTRTLFNYGTTLTGNVALLSTSSAHAAFADDTVNKSVTVTVSNLAGVWNTTSGTWDVGTSLNWSNGSDSKFFNGDSVTFNDPAVASMVTLAGALAPSSVSVNNVNAYTFSGTGAITGSATLTKSGTGRLTLDTANTYTGATTINAGTLELGANGRLGASGVYAGAIANAGSLIVGTNQNQTLSGVISGAGTLTKDGAGTLTLSGANTYTGATVVNSGTVKVGRSNAFGAVWTGKSVAQVTVNSGGAVDLNGVSDATYGYTIAGSGVGGTGALTNTGGGIGNGSAQLSNLRLAADAAVGGAGNWALLTNGYGATSLDLAGYTLTKVGANTVALASSTLTAGTLRLAQGGLALGVTNGGSGVTGTGVSLVLDDAAGASLTVNKNSSLGSISGGGANGGNTTLTATLTVGALNTSTEYAGTITGTGGLTKSGTGALTLSGAANYSGATAINGGSLGFSGAADHSLTGVVSGAGALSKSGAGTLTLSGANTYTGGTTINGGTLLVGVTSASTTSGALGAASGAVVVNSGGRLNTGLAGTDYLLRNAVTVNSGGALMGSGLLSGSLAFKSGAVVAPGNSVDTLTVSGATTFEAGSVYAWEIQGATPSVAGADFDQILVTAGTLTVQSGAILKVTSLGVDYSNAYWGFDRTFLVVDAQGSGAIAGVFTTDTSAAGAFAGRGAWSVSAANGDLFAVWTASTAVPEPSTYGLLGAGALAVAAVARRRRRAGGR